MLADAIRYSYINAKIRSLKSRLLTRSDFENLIKFTGYKGIAEYLDFTVYKRNMRDDICSFDDLIEIYHKNLFEDYEKLIDILSGSTKRLVYHLYQRYELENLKVILRTICYNRQSDHIKSLFFLSMKYKSFSTQDLMASNNLSEIIQKLKGLWYHEPLENAYYRYEKEKDIFSLEMALDLTYYNRLWEIILSMPRKDMKITKELLGIQLDIFNILWIIRFKESFHLSPEEILNYSLGHGRYISKNIRKILAYSINQQDIITNLYATPYKMILHNIDDPERGYVKLLQYTLRVAKKNWLKFPFQVGVILDYLLFKEIEVKDLLTLTEAKRIKISQDKTNQYLINAL